MAYNKQYIPQVQDNGAILISEDVVATIVSHAVMEVRGVVGLSTKSVGEVADRSVKKKWNKGIRIIIRKDGSLVIDCNVIVAYGQSIVAIAEAAQKAIINAVQSVTGVTAVGVNVNICGIVRK